MNKSIIYLLVLLISLKCVSQSTETTNKIPSDSFGNPLTQKGTVIRGRIIDKSSNLPLSGATIHWLGHSKTENYVSQKSGVNGDFMLIIPDSLIGKRMKIQVRAVGFEERTIVLKKKELPITDLRIVVKPRVYE